MGKTLFILLFLLLGFYSVFSQEINPDGYNIFYHPNGNISSEGNMVGGKPDGYWRSYYEDGTLMSEGNRLFFELDSIWNFYTSDGHLELSISYRDNVKNGYTDTYNFYYNVDSVKVYYLSSKELFFMGLLEGLSYYYDEHGHLLYTFTYKKGKRNGEGKEYDRDGLIITLFNYYNGYQIESQKINRRDKNNLKQNKWIEFYPNGNKKTEANYWDDKLHGVYKKYDLSGRLISEQRYERGELYTPKPDEEVKLKAEIKKSFYSNGIIQYEGAFLNNTPVGIHKEYNETGAVIVAKEYDENGELIGEGLFDDNGYRTGKWKLFDAEGNYYYAEGNYSKGLKEGKWTYFYPDSKVEQEGFYTNDKPDREWAWYYRDGNKKIEEEFLLGKREGNYIQYDSLGNEAAKGEYFDNEKSGEWFYNIGIITKQGQYDYGLMTGEWKYIYKENNKKRFVGKFNNGDPDGTHTWFYKNGTVEQIGDYRMGKQNKVWKRYLPDGTLYVSYTYNNGTMTKIDGIKLLSTTKKARKK
jgi:antitoxin component YwqK of YwqJK toxin-antitoxin module